MDSMDLNGQLGSLKSSMSSISDQLEIEPPTSTCILDTRMKSLLQVALDDSHSMLLTTIEDAFKSTLLTARKPSLRQGSSGIVSKCSDHPYSRQVRHRSAWNWIYVGNLPSWTTARFIRKYAMSKFSSTDVI